jgi:hypothetical protein
MLLCALLRYERFNRSLKQSVITAACSSNERD